MIDERSAWAILLLPLASFLVIAFVVRPFLDTYKKASGYIAIASIGGSFLLSFLNLIIFCTSGLPLDSSN